MNEAPLLAGFTLQKIITADLRVQPNLRLQLKKVFLLHNSSLYQLHLLRRRSTIERLRNVSEKFGHCRYSLFLLGFF